MSIKVENFITQACLIRGDNLSSSEFTQYMKLGHMSDSEMKAIMSKPSEEANKLAQVIIPTLDARDVGTQITKDEKEYLMFTYVSKKGLLNEYFYYFDLAKEYGEYLMSILPNCPITKRNIIMDSLLSLANKQNDALYCLLNIGSDIKLSRSDTKNRGEMYHSYSRIMQIRNMASDIIRDKELINAIATLTHTNKDSILNAFVSHYLRRREVLSNTGVDIMAEHHNSIVNGCKMQNKDLDALNAYINAVTASKAPLNEYQQATEAKLYYIH